MSVRYEIDAVRSVVLVTVEGVVSDEDYFAAGEQLRRDPAFRSHFCELIDLSAASLAGLTTDGVRRIAAHEPDRDSKARTAIVAPSDLEFGIARMFEALREQRSRVAAFRDMDEARRWLGLT